ncbi:MAG: 50S ribosomal protein L4 [Mycoplasmataceae bacterium]|nr:50S ribosomal protein L4 [Mycoplasmataceae bacterium]
MAKLDIVNVLGKKLSTIDIADEVFAIKPHNQAMFDLVLAERASLRQGTHSTKTRTEVSGGGRKPWKQKGTGRARQGSIRSPQWRGGGVVFGPTPERNYSLKINRKVKKLALKSGWSYKFSKDQLYIVDNMEFQSPVTKDFKKLLENLQINKKKVLLLLSDNQKDYNTYLSARNISNVVVYFPRTVLLDDILNADAILMQEDSLRLIEGGLK